MNTIPEPIAVEARAKLMWGENPEKVRAFLESKKIAPADAEALIEKVAAESAEATRAEGKKKAGWGVLFLLAPVIYYFVAVALGSLMVKLFAALIVLGVIGIAQITKGLSMALRPRAVKENLSERF